jgi:hypothetical protein
MRTCVLFPPKIVEKTRRCARTHIGLFHEIWDTILHLRRACAIPTPCSKLTIKNHSAAAAPMLLRHRPAAAIAVALSHCRHRRHQRRRLADAATKLPPPPPPPSCRRHCNAAKLPPLPHCHQASTTAATALVLSSSCCRRRHRCRAAATALPPICCRRCHHRAKPAAELLLHYWVYLGTYIGTYLLVTGSPTTRDTSQVVLSVPWLCAKLHDTNSHMRLHTYEFVCDCSIIRFCTYNLVLLLFITRSLSRVIHFPLNPIKNLDIPHHHLLWN